MLETRRAPGEDGQKRVRRSQPEVNLDLLKRTDPDPDPKDGGMIVKETHFWLMIAVLTGLLSAVLGGTISGIGGAIGLGMIGFIGTLLTSGMICTGAKRNYPEEEEGETDDEIVEV